MMKIPTWSILLGPIFLLTSMADAQSSQPDISFEIDPNCVGLLVDASAHMPIGTGFVLEESNTVITARHVAINLNTLTPQTRTLEYQPPADLQLHVIPPALPLTAVNYDEGLDLAILHIDGNSPCKRSFKRSEVDAQVGYGTVYLGFDPPTQSFKVSSHRVRNINHDNGRKFIEIEGDARPGYSGGPLFDQRGDVLGVILKGTISLTSISIFQAISIQELPKLLPTLAAQKQNQHPRIQTELKETDLADIGNVIALGPDTVTVKNEGFTRVFRIDGQTSILRVDSTPLQIGDQVGVRCHFDGAGVAIADSIEANVDRWEGVITKVAGNSVYIKGEPIRRTVKVVFDGKTEFDYCTADEPNRSCSRADLRVGRFLETIGFVVAPSELRATRVLDIQKRVRF